MNKYTLLAFSVALVACAGSDPDPDVFDDDDGNGGSDSASSVDSTTGTGNDSVTGTGTGNTVTGGCTPTVSCESIGAECGTINDDGCGNSVVCPNNCTGVNTCGGNGDQFKCGCTPADESNFPNGCGVVSDGCGNNLDLGGCGDYPHVSCGGNGPPDNQGNPGTPGTPNICNGGCTRDIRTNSAIICSYEKFPPEPYVCSTDANEQPFANCVMLNDPAFPNVWCCPAQE